MGIRIEFSEISKLVVVYFVLITMCCDKYANCDTTIHAMRQKQLADSSEVDFKINATELHEHIMRGLNMTKKPDIRLASISQDEFFSKYAEYLSRLSYRMKKTSKIFGSDVTNHVYDENDADGVVKKIIAFKNSNNSNLIASQQQQNRHRRRRRSSTEDEVVSLDFELRDHSDFPSVVEQSILNVLIMGGDETTGSDKPWRPHWQIVDSDSEDDENSSSGDIVRKFTPKTYRKNELKSQRHHRHHNHHRSLGKVEVSSSSASVKLHVYLQTSREREHVLMKEIPLPIATESDSSDAKIEFNKWISLDLTTIVNDWLQKDEQTLSIDLYCDSCTKHGLKIVNRSPDDGEFISTKDNPTLNIIGSVVRTKRKIGNKHKKRVEKLGEDKDFTKPKKTFCKKNGDKACCRHRWVVDLKDLQLDYVIEPKHFDAGFCDGTCRFRENVANNHAFFQSLARNHSHHSHVPNVCCAPTRFVDMEILHIDEEDHSKLKVTTMKKMKAMRCQCT